jgi:uncharacterized protein
MSVRRSLAALGFAGWSATLAGCGVVGQTASSYAVTPLGLPVREQEVRDLLPTAGRDTGVHEVPRRLTPRDDLIEALYDGTWAYYAGDWARAGKGFELASSLAEDRFTKSLRENAAALLTNDMALAYTPGHTERLFTHYYGSLAWAGAGNWENAAVEARRLGALLQQLEPQMADRDRSSRAMLRFVSGAVFEAAGDDNDADVSYRNARVLAGADSLSLPGRVPIPRDSGDVVVLVEHGWVAHKVAQDLIIPVYGSEAKAFGPKGNVGEQLATGATLAGRVLLVAATMPEQGIWWVNGQPTVINSWGPIGTGQRLDKDGYMLKLSWPVLRRSFEPQRFLAASGAITGNGGLTANLNDAIAADASRDRRPVLTRTIARQAVKLAASEAAEAKATKKWGDVTGSIVGGLLNAAGAAMERADTRGWLLLPASISAVRVRLPVGQQPVTAVVNGQSRDIGTVNVRPGRVTVVSRRVWSSRVGAVADALIESRPRRGR